jgi:hypothetical protein
LEKEGRTRGTFNLAPKVRCDQVKSPSERRPQGNAADLTYRRRWRKSAEQLHGYPMKTAVVAGGVGAFCLGFKTILGK